MVYFACTKKKNMITSYKIYKKKSQLVSLSRVLEQQYLHNATTEKDRVFSKKTL
jgi:hypothetical protein